MTNLGRKIRITMTIRCDQLLENLIYETERTFSTKKYSLTGRGSPFLIVDKRP